MVLTADDQQIVMQADIVIGVARVPGECFRHCARRHARADHVGHVGRLLGVDGEEIVDRHIRRDHHGIGRDDVFSDMDQSRHAAFGVIGVAVAEDAAAVLADRLREARQVLQRVELPLLRKAQAGAGVPVVG